VRVPVWFPAPKLESDPVMARPAGHGMRIDVAVAMRIYRSIGRLRIHGGAAVRDAALFRPA
jgi:hypothetical protein